MARPKYLITECDYPFAHQYLSSKFTEQRGRWFQTTDDHFPPVSVSQLIDTFELVQSVDTLNQWAESHLNRTQWIQLKNAIRARRKRFKRQGAFAPKTITLDHRAWKILSDLSKAEQCTLSELVDKYLQDPWQALNQMKP